MSNHPQMPVTAKWFANKLNPGQWLLRGTCPLCGHTHTHGGGTGTTPTGYGHRVAHCHTDTPPRGYVLTSTDETTP